MLSGFMGALITMQKNTYAVGEYPVYLITNAQPGAELWWTTWLDTRGSSAIDYQQSYGQYIGPDGTLKIVWADPLYKSDVGNWKKRIDLINPDGTVDVLWITYAVVATGAAPSPAPVSVPTPAPTPTPVAPRSIGLDPFYKPLTRDDVPRTLYPTTTLPPVSRDPYQTPPIIPMPPVVVPDILNPAPLPAPVPVRTPILTPVPTQPVYEPTLEPTPRSLYPMDAAPRPPMYTTRDDTVPRSTLDLPPLVPTTPTGPTTPGGSSGGGDILNPAPTGPTTQQPTTQQPGGQTSSGGGLGGSIKIAGVDIPIWLLIVGGVLLVKGGR